jgi:hypothetical protein
MDCRGCWCFQISCHRDLVGLNRLAAEARTANGTRLQLLLPAQLSKHRNSWLKSPRRKNSGDLPNNNERAAVGGHHAVFNPQVPAAGCSERDLQGLSGLPGGLLFLSHPRPLPCDAQRIAVQPAGPELASGGEQRTGPHRPQGRWAPGQKKGLLQRANGQRELGDQQPRSSRN